MSDDEFGQRVFDQVFSLWIEPELVRRGIAPGRTQVHAGLVVLPPGGSPEVHINDEAQIVATVKARGPVSAGAPVALDQVEEIERLYSASVDPNAGWICFARVGDAISMGFDFRRNRERATRLVALGDEYLAVAAAAADRSLLGPAIENAFAAAELAVKAEMHLIGDDPSRGRHRRRQRHWSQWATLGNVAKSHADTLAALGGARASARYGDGKLSMHSADVRAHLSVVAEMLRHAIERIGEPLPDRSAALSSLDATKSSDSAVRYQP